MNLHTKWLVQHKKEFPWQALLGGTLLSNDGRFSLISNVIIRPWPSGPLFTINNLDPLEPKESLFNIVAFESGRFIEVRPLPTQLLVINEFKHTVDADIARNITNRAAEEQRGLTKIQEKLQTIVANDGLLAENNLNKIMEKFAEFGITKLWHITHKDNIAGILERGILNHYNAHRTNLNLVDISDPKVQDHRENTESVYHRKIHEYVPLYINYRNKMLYKRQNLQEHLCLLEVSLAVLSEAQYVFTDGNAASYATKYYQSLDELKLLPWDVLNAVYWNDFPDGGRKSCAEVLVYLKIPPKFIMNIHCYSKNTFDFLSKSNENVFLTRTLFF